MRTRALPYFRSVSRYLSRKMVHKRGRSSLHHQEELVARKAYEMISLLIDQAYRNVLMQMRRIYEGH